MDRKKFLKKGLLGLGTIVTVPTIMASCNKDDNGNTPSTDPNACAVSPYETAGPYPNKTPADLVRENIIGDRVGIPLLITINVQNVNNNCTPIEGVLVDIWHCDAVGDYSQYSNNTAKNFLRGRQTTDANGNASFISIFPGWYNTRAPHIHIDIRDSNENSLYVTQISFPPEIYNAVYATPNYEGPPRYDNERDEIVTDENLAHQLTGNITDGYTLVHNVRFNR